ncbi:caspase family protein [Pseudarthrobacter sp. RMG13]|uniref:Caspase family protein n=1 Tax=Pseudarthrobacter humi TaxID=2952523 RepID=A0ABT1LPF0_9MICC|nr:caspase family protein [Pseudarthrobacter humi]MCP9000338.1 caspase family protein [Pseudarthrobacter humi]
MTGYSLHIGLNGVDPNAYNGWNGALSGCVNDANSMMQLASAQGFTPTQLLNSQATSQAIIGEISLLAQQAVAGDICLITYSGHGGQVDDNNGDEMDTQDETWVAYDRQIVDDELYQMWSQFAAGVRILVCADSCHSGTSVRQIVNQGCRKGLLEQARSLPKDAGQQIKVTEGAPKAMPLTVQGHDNDNRRGTYQFVQALSGAKSDATIPASVILIAGCQDSQLSYDGAVNGQFTGALLQAWGNGSFQGDYTTFHKAILNGMPPDQVPNLYTTGSSNPAFMAQRPFTLPAPTGGSANGSTPTSPSGGSSGGPAAPMTRPQIRRGSTGEHVTYLQQQLAALGYRLSIDGIFGPGTESAVRSFQRTNGLTADGIVGPQTWAAVG